MKTLDFNFNKLQRGDLILNMNFKYPGSVFQEEYFSDWWYEVLEVKEGQIMAMDSRRGYLDRGLITMSEDELYLNWYGHSMVISPGANCFQIEIGRLEIFRPTLWQRILLFFTGRTFLF